MARQASWLVSRLQYITAKLLSGPKNSFWTCTYSMISTHIRLNHKQRTWVVHYKAWGEEHTKGILQWEITTSVITFSMIEQKNFPKNISHKSCELTFAFSQYLLARIVQVPERPSKDLFKIFEILLIYNKCPTSPLWSFILLRQQILCLFGSILGRETQRE